MRPHHPASRTATCLAAGFFALWVTTPIASAQTAPANDNFINAQILTTDGTLAGTNVDATAEQGEPQHASVPVGASVWYQWTAPADGFLTVDTVGSDFDTVLAMYAGPAVDQLSVLAANDDTLGLQSELPNVFVESGSVYQIAVDGYNAATGQITLTWTFFDEADTVPPDVTIFSPVDGSTFVQDAIVLADYFCEDQVLGTGVLSCIGDAPVDNPIDTSTLGSQGFTVTGTDNAGNVNVVTANYTVSGTDVTPPTVSITSPIDGAILVQGSVVTAAYNCMDELFGTGIATCTGDVPSGDPIDTSLEGSFMLTVTGTDNAGNSTVATSSYTVIGSLANDDFANAEVLATDGSWIGTNVSATKEPGEPNHANNAGGASVWFQWTAPVNGYLTVETFGSNFDTTLAIYTGVTVDALTVVAFNDDAIGLQSRLADVPVTAGTVYHVAVDGYGGATGQINLAWSFFDGTDTTPPQVFVFSPADGATFVENAIVPADYSCVDEPLGTGIATCIGDVPVDSPIDTAAPGAHSFTVTGTDNAGNVNVATVSYTVSGTDISPPVVAITLPTDGGTYVENAIVNASYACFDEALGTGIASCTGDVPHGSAIDTSTPGAHVFTVTGTDNAGNVSVATANYTVDGTDVTAPFVEIISPVDGAFFGVGAAVTATYQCLDDAFGTGIATCVGDVPDGALIDTSVEGTYTFTVTGTDNAGNSAIESHAYTVVGALPNDNFADAVVLADSGTWTGSNIGATKEPGEPDHANNTGGASVWFEWTATLTGYFTVDTFGSGFDTTLAMYTGTSVDALTAVAFNDDTSGAQSRLLNTPVTAGTTYKIAVDGYFGTTGGIALNWAFSEQFDTVAPSVTIWDPVDGLVRPQGAVETAYYTCFDPSPSSGMASCVGDVPINEPIDTSTPGTFTFTATGTDNAGNVTVATASYTVVANPPNDDFVDAIGLATEGTTAGTNAGATKEPGEPNHGGNVGGTSVWFLWTAPADGFITVDTFGSDFDTILAIYTGNSVDALTEVASNVDAPGSLQSKISFARVDAGVTYSIALTGWIYSTGQYTMTWSFLELNDLTPPTITLTTPSDGMIFFEGVSVLADYMCFDEFLGAGLASCTGSSEVGTPIDTTIAGPYTFTVTAIDNAGNSTVQTNAYAVVPFTNDDFANAMVVTGDDSGLIATNVGATKEPDEPDHAGNTGGASIWFQWTAVEDAFLTVDTFGTDFDTTLALYTGTTVGALTEVGSNNNATPFDTFSEVADVLVLAGQTYYIAVDGLNGAIGQIALNWTAFDGPVFREMRPPLDPLWVTDADHDFWLNAAAPADVDGDGDLDLAVIGFFVEYNVSAEDRLVVFMNEGIDPAGNWVVTQQEVPLTDISAGASDLAWGDYDNDGDPDLAVASDGITAIFRNDAGTLVRIATDLPGYYEDSGYTGAYDLRSITWADFDNDADLDLLIPSTFDFDNFVFGTALMRNDGDDGLGGWTFTEVPTSLDPTVHAQTAWADNDGDGDLDLFMANVDNYTGNGYVRSYRNDGGGLFTMAEPIGSLTVEYGLADWSDYDGDGDLDILVVGLVQEINGTYTTILRVYDNVAGVLVPNTLVQSSFFPWLDLHAATWADYDNDGDVDILLTGQVIGPHNLEGKSVIYVNDGGTFSPLPNDLPAPIGTIGRGGSFTWFDADGDFDLDYLVAGAYFIPFGNNSVEAQMHLYRNDSLTSNAAPGAPTGMGANVTTRGAGAGSVELFWNAATDDATATAAITYQLEVRPQGTGAPGARHRLPEPGNVSAVTSWSVQGLTPGTYDWTLQAVDSAFNGGPVATSSFTIGGGLDSDGDGIDDATDNCTVNLNADQRDTDSDGIGNRCDPDFNNDCVVNFADLNQMKQVFFSSDANADLDGSGMVNFADLDIMKSLFFGPPGPSAAGCN